uniref:Uncharacterized protein n=1 Tax=Anguilla anguilla TaxID=7936 RepID=A0A0E9Q9I2_ANGAN
MHIILDQILDVRCPHTFGHVVGSTTFGTKTYFS